MGDCKIWKSTRLNFSRSVRAQIIVYSEALRPSLPWTKMKTADDHELNLALAVVELGAESGEATIMTGKS